MANKGNDIVSELDKNFAIALGMVYREKGTLSRSEFNKIISSDGLGYERFKKHEFSTFVEEVQEDGTLYEIFLEAGRGALLVDDITPANINLPGVSDNELPSILSTTMYDTMAVKRDVAQFRKFQREVAVQRMITEGISEALVATLEQGIEIVERPSLTKLSLNENSMIVQLSDWHIGALVDVDGNSYDLETATRRLRTYMDEVARQFAIYKPRKVLIVHVGDFIEHISMRANDQAYNAEYLSSEQVTLAIKMLSEVITEIASYAEEVEVAMVGGNHDRMQGNKNEGIHGDSAAFIIQQQISLLNDYEVFGDNVTVADNSTNIYRAEVKLEDKTVVIVHGDNLKKNQPAAKTLMTDHIIDLVLVGHFHYFNATQEALTAQTIMGGSLQGYNSYSQRLHTPNSMASQNIIIVPEGRDASLTITPVMLP